MVKLLQCIQKVIFLDFDLIMVIELGEAKPINLIIYLSRLLIMLKFAYLKLIQTLDWVGEINILSYSPLIGQILRA